MNEVFGVSRDLPLNYVERDKVDNKLFLALAQNHHIVIHGSSKQGKTCLRKWNIEIRTIAELNAAILKAVGYKVEKSQSVTVSGKHRVTARLGQRRHDSGVARTRERLMDGIVQDQASRAESFIDSFSAGPTTMLTTIYRWTIFTVLACDIARLEGGLSVAEISEFIGTFGAPVDPNLRDLIRELPEISEFQMHHLEISHHKGAAHPRKPVRAPRPVRPAPRPAADA